ncbi:MAG TPA: metalloregulator ArsR/SmtB family transcription factor [Tepidisphaeraceae bacterium]|jgi:ArsR family transcriptional regulator
MVRAAAQVDLLLGWMGSLADPTRLRLLRLIEQHELCVAELCEILQLPQSTVSRHLKVLCDEGWADSRRQGTVRLYRLSATDLDPAARRLWHVAREQTEPWPAVRQDQLRLARRLQERRNRTEAFFAGAAGQWDRLRDELYGSAFTTQAMLALLPDDATVADLGCGTGQTAARLAPWVGKVIGIDSSAAMLKAARGRTEGLANVELRRADLTAVPIDDSSCDAALLMLVLSYVPDPAAVVKEMFRILKPGGRAVVIDLLPHDRDDFRERMGQHVLGFEPERVRAILQAGGFEVTRCLPLPPEADAKGPALFLAAARRSVG